jgi:hypothetical protein
VCCPPRNSVLALFLRSYISTTLCLVLFSFSIVFFCFRVTAFITTSNQKYPPSNRASTPCGSLFSFSYFPRNPELFTGYVPELLVFLSGVLFNGHPRPRATQRFVNLNFLSLSLTDVYFYPFISLFMYSHLRTVLTPFIGLFVGLLMMLS